MNGERNKTIIIHSKLSFGYAGSNTTSLVLELGGKDIITIPTVLYSAHLGYPKVGGDTIPTKLYKDLLQGVLDLDIMDEVSAIITGYMGSAVLAKITAEFIKDIKSKYPDIMYICDPVMGDIGRDSHVASDIAKVIIEELLPLADIATPNQFEFQLIVGNTINNAQTAFSLFTKHRILSKKQFVITGCRFGNKPQKKIETLILNGGQYISVESDIINVDPLGTGDLFAAHLYLALAQNIPLNEAVKCAVNIMQRVLIKMENEKRSNFDLSDIIYSMNT